MLASRLVWEGEGVTAGDNNAEYKAPALKAAEGSGANISSGESPAAA
jgi:hypothetical protein